MWGVLHCTASFMGKLSALTWVLCATTQLMSLPLSAAVGTMRYSLVIVTVLSAPGVDTVVPLPLAAVTQEISAAGRPFRDSQRATTTGLVPASTVTVEAEFWGLADGRIDVRRVSSDRKGNTMQRGD